MPTRIFTAREALQHRHRLTTYCICGSRDVDLQALIDAGYGDIEFPELRRRLVCQGCHKRIWSMQVGTGWNPYPGAPIVS